MSTKPPYLNTANWLVTESFAHTLLIVYFCWNQVVVLWDSAMRIRKKVRSEEQPGHDVGWCRTTLLAVNSWLIPASAATARYMSTTWLVGNSIWKFWPTGWAEFFLHCQSRKEEGARYCLLVVYSDQSECFVIRGMQGWFQQTIHSRSRWPGTVGQSWQLPDGRSDSRISVLNVMHWLVRATSLHVDPAGSELSFFRPKFRCGVN